MRANSIHSKRLSGMRMAHLLGWFPFMRSGKCVLYFLFCYSRYRCVLFGSQLIFNQTQPMRWIFSEYKYIRFNWNPICWPLSLPRHMHIKIDWHMMDYSNSIFDFWSKATHISEYFAFFFCIFPSNLLYPINGMFIQGFPRWKKFGYFLLLLLLLLLLLFVPSNYGTQFHFNDMSIMDRFEALLQHKRLLSRSLTFLLANQTQMEIHRFRVFFN